MSSKICRICGELKELSEFSKHPSGKDGHRNACKSCENARDRKERLDNPEKTRQKEMDNYYKNHSQKLLIRKIWRDSNKDRILVSKRASRERNRDTHRLNRARRRAQKRNATVVWASKFAIKTLYSKARRLEVWLGVELHVDHIVPLTSEYVCGLHCEANLQILEKRLNIQKSNLVWPDMW